MRSIDPHSAQRLGRQSAATALALRITRRDNREIGLTDHDTDLSFGGTTFGSFPGLGLRTLELSADLAPDHAEITTAVSDEGISARDLAEGRFAAARAEIWRVDAEGVTARTMLSCGTIGEIARRGDALTLEFRSLTHALSKTVGRVYQKSCDARLGDRRCGVDLAAYSASVTAWGCEGLLLRTSVPSGMAPALFEGGTAVSADGQRAAVRTAGIAGGMLNLTLWERFGTPPAEGTLLTLTGGCDKSFSTCRDRFANAQGFRGFPAIPGMKVLTVAGGEGG